MSPASNHVPNPPDVFGIARMLKAGRYPLLEVFPGLDRVPAFGKYPGSAATRRQLAAKSTVDIAPRRGEWMYVAPHRMPRNADRRWKPVVTKEDCVVVSREHLRKSPAMVLYLDILHELYHVTQRWAGRELWDEGYSYVDRPTEVEAYQFAVDEARRLKVKDAFLRDYLKVMWVTPEDHLRLLKNVGVKAR
jgi:hypothetical protein